MVLLCVGSHSYDEVQFFFPCFANSLMGIPEADHVARSGFTDLCVLWSLLLQLSTICCCLQHNHLAPSYQIPMIFLRFPTDQFEKHCSRHLFNAVKWDIVLDMEGS